IAAKREAVGAYASSAFVVYVPLARLAHNIFVPTLSSDKRYLVAILAVLETATTPYCFFWQSSQEAEDEHIDPTAQPDRSSAESKVGNRPDSRRRLSRHGIFQSGLPLSSSSPGPLP